MVSVVNEFIGDICDDISGFVAQKVVEILEEMVVNDLVCWII